MLNGDFLPNQDFKLDPPTMAAAACMEKIHFAAVLDASVCA